MTWLTDDFNIFDQDFGEERTLKLLTSETINLKTGNKTKTETIISITIVPASITEKDLRLFPNLIKIAETAIFINSEDAEIKKNDIIDNIWLVVEIIKTQGILKAFVRVI